MSFLSQPITLQSLFRKDRSFGPITVQVVIQEVTTDVLTITRQPVQTGASITDHAFKEPTTFSAQMHFEDNLFLSLKEIYDELLDLQNSRVPFDIITPKRTYPSMLLASLSMTTDRVTENILSVSLSFQQIILVSIATASVPRNRQRNSKVTEKTQKTGKKSILKTGAEGLQSLIGR